MTYAPLVTLSEEEGLVKGIPLFAMIDGNEFWVDSAAGGVAQNGSFSRPMTTIDAAINLCISGNNDHIFVKAGHTETITDATSLNCDLADVAIVGLGHGSKRPKITLGTANTTTIPVTAANVMFKNIVFVANFLDIAALFTLTTAPSFTCLDCKFIPGTGSVNFVDIVDISATDNAADDLIFSDCEWIDDDTGTKSLLNGDGDMDGLTVLDCYIKLGINGVIPAMADMTSGKDASNVNIQRNFVFRLTADNSVQFIQSDTTTNNTGLVAFNHSRSSDTAGETLVTATTEIMFYNNFQSGVAGKSGYLLPAADT